MGLKAIRTLSITLAGLILVVSGNAIAGSVDDGKKLAFDRKKGNCLACHKIAGGTMPGNMGPPLMQMKSRFPDKKKLRAQIWDATKRNPDTPMPPFGRHRILSEGEIDKITDYIHTL